VLAPSLLAHLVCPVSHGKLIYFPDDAVLVCPASKLRYRIENDFPVMLAEEAQTLGDAEIAELISKAKRLGLPIPT
jgi:uncharacterized protein YbaR (Trm112 family)